MERLYPGALLLALALAFPAFAQDRGSNSPPPQANAEMPQAEENSDFALPMPERERKFVSMLTEISKRYGMARTTSQKSDSRMLLEVRVADFMDESQDAVDWTGIVRGTHTTTEGDAWIVIEIAPDVTLSTWNNRFTDRDDLTLIRRYSDLHKQIDELKVGEPVVFTATMLMYDISSDDDMVERPHLIARFKSIRPAS